MEYLQQKKLQYLLLYLLGIVMVLLCSRNTFSAFVFITSGSNIAYSAVNLNSNIGIINIADTSKINTILLNIFYNFFIENAFRLNSTKIKQNSAV